MFKITVLKYSVLRDLKYTVRNIHRQWNFLLQGLSDLYYFGHGQSYVAKIWLSVVCRACLLGAVCREL